MYVNTGSGEEGILFWGLSPSDNNQQINSFKAQFGITNPCAGIEGGGPAAISVIISGQNFFGYPTYCVICPDRSIYFDICWPPTEQCFYPYFEMCIPPLLAEFSVIEYEVCEGSDVQFTDESSGNIISWEWIFEGGSPGTSTLQNPVVSYNSQGLFDVSLTISDGTNQNTITHQDIMEVDASPAAFAGADSETCVDSPFTVEDASAENFMMVSWIITNGEGILENQNSLTPTYVPNMQDAGMIVQLSLIAFGKGECTGLTAISNKNLHVQALPNVTCPENFSTCLNSGLIELQQALPTGGSYTGTGVSGYYFNPSSAGPGSHEITYTFTDENGCENSCFFVIKVNPLPVLVCPGDTIVCVDADPFELTQAQPAGGTYSGTGVLNGVFDPQIAGSGDHSITYTYVDENACPASCEFIISVKPLPVLTCPGNYAVCENADSFLLTGASPPGGTYSGKGVSENIFDPAIAGTGVKNITYTYQDVYGCSNSCQFDITVLPIPEVYCAENMEVCIDVEPFVIENLSPEGGSLSGNGISGEVFDPELAGTGTHEITYEYTSPVNFCTNSCTFYITTYPLPEISCGGNIEVCQDAEPFILENGQPSGGNYSGTGVENGIFDPALAGIGAHTINYVYMDGNSCTANCTFEIVVHPVPEPVCPENFSTCIYEEPFAITGVSPPGGVFTGNGMDNGIFDPAAAGVGIHNIQYIFTNEFGCTDICGFSIKVNPMPEINCNFPEEVCKYDGPIPLEDCLPAGGNYSGTGVAGNTFFPEIADEGEHHITYHFADPETGCENETTFIIRVKPSQIVEVPSGWSGISSFLIPENLEIPEIFAGMQNQLEILYNFNGDLYYPGGNVYPANPWDVYSGYCLKVNGTVETDFCGEYLQETEVELDAGWNLIPMLSKTPVSCDFMFGFNDDVKIVKQVAGWKVYWNEMGVNTLVFVNPGKAYFVYCTSATSITYPYAADQSFTKPEAETPILSPFEVVRQTPGSHVIAFTTEAFSVFQQGDVIAGFTAEGICAGQTMIQKDNAILVLFADDPYTNEKEGFGEGDICNYKLYRTDEDQVYDITMLWMEAYQNGNSFSNHGISVAGNISLSGVGISSVHRSDVSIYPNPTTGTIHISGIQGDFVVSVYNTIREQVLIDKLNGESQISLAPNPKGIYMIKITTKDFSITEKVVLN